MYKTTPTSINHRNWSGLIFPGIMPVGFMGYVGYLLLKMNLSDLPEAPGWLGWSIYVCFVLLSYELFINTLIEIENTQTTITFRKPWKRYSLIFRRSRQQWIINNEEWDEVFIFINKSSYSLYFRKERMGAFFATIEDGRKITKSIEAFFPGKKVHWDSPYDYPKVLRKKMKKEYPERVMRG